MTLPCQLLIHFGEAAFPPYLTARKFQLSGSAQRKDKYRVLFEIYENFESRSHKSALFSRDKTSRRRVKKQKRASREREREEARESERHYPEPRGVERRRDAKVASFAEGEGHGLTVRVLRDKWRRWVEEDSTRTEKNRRKFKAARWARVPPRLAIGSNSTYGPMRRAGEHPRLWRYVLFFVPPWLIIYLAAPRFSLKIFQLL